VTEVVDSSGTTAVLAARRETPDVHDPRTRIPQARVPMTLIIHPKTGHYAERI
jgi:hypothetical protein